jgi:quercetin dioxygenase-like cupin family protein
MKIISVAGDRLAILLSGEDTQQKYVVMESAVPPNAGPPPHVHSREDESFLVLAGQITFYLGGKTMILKEGDFITAPRGIPHHFKNTSQRDALLLITATPAGIEQFFEKAGRPLLNRQVPPHPLTPEDVARLRSLAPEYGIEILARPQ